MQKPGVGLQLKCKFHLTCAKLFQAAESLSICVLVLLFSRVVIARNHKILSAFCAYTKLDFSNEFRKAEKQCTIKPEREPEGEIYKEKVR